jgi:hypothetical protein
MRLGPRDFTLRVKAEIEAILSDPQPPPYTALREVDLKGIELQGVAPHLDLVLFFGHSSKPGCVFGFRWRDVSGEAAHDAEQQEKMTGQTATDTEMVDWLAKLILINLSEQLEADDLGLPNDCNPQSITWLS